MQLPCLTAAPQAPRDIPLFGNYPQGSGNLGFLLPDSKKGILDYRIIKELNNYFLLEIDLHTGRHHQIRSQLSAIGCPIKGDLKYGFDRSNPDGSIHLDSRKLVLIHPVTKEELTFVAPPPTEDSIWKACTDN